MTPPEDFNPILFQDYSGGVNTLVGRTAIHDNQTAWCDGWYPLAPDCLRTMPDIGPALYTAPTGLTIVWFGWENIFTYFFCIVLLSDGSVVAIRKDTGVVTPLLPAGTITNSGVSARAFRINQWSNLYVLMVSAQDNGYWIWDMVNVYTAGTVGPVVTITDPGRDPSLSQLVQIGLPTVGGLQAVANGTVQFDSKGNVVGVTITGLVGPPISQVQAPLLMVAFGPGGGGYSTAFGSVGVANGVITAATLTNGGAGYTSIPTINVSDPTGTGAVIIVTSASGGILTGLKVVSGGANYTAPVVTFTGGGGSNAAAAVTISQGVLSGPVPISLGGGYIGNPTPYFLSATGAGAQATAVVVNGQVTITITAGGQGYTSPTYYALADGDGPAAATVQAMPFGVSGTAIEVYKSRVWITNGRAFVAGFGTAQATGRTIFSASGSPVNFGGDGGAFPATDSFTSIGYMNLKQVNGFLWLIGDNSLNYISNVTTSTTGTPPVTTALFSNINADPQTGSLWPSSVQVMGRRLVYANGYGIFVSDGGAATKVSEALDGIYYTRPDAVPQILSDWPAAVSDIYGRRTYCLLYPIVDPITNNPVNIILCWDGRRCFTTRQRVPLIFIATLSAASQETAWGTDGTSIYQLFFATSNNFTKTLQSKLYANPAYWVTKVENELHGVFTVNLADGQPLNVTIDTEAGQGTGNASVALSPTALAVFVNNSGQPVQFVNNNNAVVSFGAKGYSVFGPVPVANWGRLVGLTITTTAADIVLNSMMIQARNETLNV